MTHVNVFHKLITGLFFKQTFVFVCQSFATTHIRASKFVSILLFLTPSLGGDHPLKQPFERATRGDSSAHIWADGYICYAVHMHSFEVLVTH